jgi:hypothetical protein
MTAPRLLGLACVLTIAAAAPATARASITITAQGGGIRPENFATSDGSDGGGELTDPKTIPNHPGAATVLVAGSPPPAGASSSVGSAHASVSTTLRVSSTVSQTSGMIFTSSMVSSGSASTHRETADNEAARGLEATAGEEGGSSIQFTIDQPMNYTLSGGLIDAIAAESREADESVRLNGPHGPIEDSETGQGVSGHGLLPAGSYSLSSEAFMNLTAGEPNMAGGSKSASGSVGFDVTFGLTPAADADGDGLPDQWETDGIDLDGDGTVDLDLPAMGSDPQHKDVFLEIDAMAGHEISQSAVNSVVQAFASAPVPNPDGSTGITLHVDNGASSVMDPTTGEVWGTLSDHDVLAHQQILGSEVGGAAYNWSAFDVLKAANFSPLRRPAFHYVISAHQFGAPDELATGLSRGIQAGDFLLTDGFCAPPKDQPADGSECPATAQEDAGVLMHELGHNLGLHHGGTDDVNYKPNYLSIMNYDFTFSWLRKTSFDRVLDYSRFDNPPLNENALDESQGFGVSAGSGAAAFFTVVWCPPLFDSTEVMGPGPVDFNCNLKRDSVLSADVNRDGLRTTLTGPDDWSRLVYSGGGVGSLAPPVLPLTTPQNEAPVTELLADEAVVDGRQPSAPTPPRSTSPGPATTTTPTPATRATCTLRPGSSSVATRGSKRGRLTITARCDAAATLKLRAKVTSIRRVHRRLHTTTASLAAASVHAKPNTTVSIKLTLPRTTLSALTRGNKTSATLTLQVTSAGGVRTITTRIARLTAQHRH